MITATADVCAGEALALGEPLRSDQERVAVVAVVAGNFDVRFEVTTADWIGDGRSVVVSRPGSPVALVIPPGARLFAWLAACELHGNRLVGGPSPAEGRAAVPATITFRMGVLS